jgi:hypothetical protein
VFTENSFPFYRKLTGTFTVPRALPNATATNKMEEMMTRLVILSLALGLVALPAYAQNQPPQRPVQPQQKSLNINGNLFDSPTEQGYMARPGQPNAGPQAMMPRAAAPRPAVRHVRRHRTTQPSG